jgi:hypothetical protein
VKNGHFYRQDDRKWVQRYLCRGCGKSFSQATGRDTYRQKRRSYNHRIRWLLSIKVNLRAIARYLKLSRGTVAARLDFHGERGRRYFANLSLTGLIHVHFDELQSSIHTKCKPVAIPMAVDVKSRRILALSVASMPAQHPLKQTALRKYGPRADDRPEAIAAVLRRIGPMLAQGCQLTSDSAPRYPAPVKRLLPHVTHVTVLSRKGCVTGQGELKKTGFDPLFTLNHTAAMIRDGTSRMVRRTWANSKRFDRLESHLLVYAHFYNEVYLKSLRPRA